MFYSQMGTLEGRRTPLQISDYLVKSVLLKKKIAVSQINDRDPFSEGICLQQKQSGIDFTAQVLSVQD